MMKDFLEGLSENANRIISEASPLNEADGGKTFQELADGTSAWGYIPKPKEGKGFGSAKNTLLYIKENSADSWDIYVMKQVMADKVGGAADKQAAAAVRKRPTSEPSDSDKPTSEAKEMAHFIAITESVLNGEMLNESNGKIEGDTAKLKDDSWKTSKVLSNLKFSDLLNKCVAVVDPESGGSKSFIR